jgi:hypothetical protein
VKIFYNVSNLRASNELVSDERTAAEDTMEIIIIKKKANILQYLCISRIGIFV